MTDHDPYSPKDPAVFVDRFETGDAKPATDSVAVTPAEPELPKGTSAEILAWVGEDKDRAQKALDHENESHKPRKGLVEELEEIVSK